MRSPSKLARVAAPVALAALFLVVASRSFNASVTRSGQDTVAQTTSESTLTPRSFLPFVARKWPPFSDEFDDNKLDLAKWDVISGTPAVGDGQLTLPGGTTRAEIQSKDSFQYGVLQAAIQSPNWVSHTEVTDSSFGFEIWTGANGKCHHGVILIANGHLGLLRSQPDANNNCSGDPEYQAYEPISNWDALRAANTISLTLTWSPRGVTLYVSDVGSNSGQASYTGEAEPTVPLEVRLNADYDESYRVDYIRVYQDP